MKALFTEMWAGLQAPTRAGENSQGLAASQSCAHMGPEGYGDGAATAELCRAGAGGGAARLGCRSTEAAGRGAQLDPSLLQPLSSSGALTDGAQLEAGEQGHS